MDDKWHDAHTLAKYLPYCLVTDIGGDAESTGGGGGESGWTTTVVARSVYI